MEGSFIIFDGECGFCNKTILFLAQEDINDNIVFLSNRSKRGIKIMNIYKINEKVPSKTIVLIKNNKVYIKSEAFVQLIEEIPRIKKIKYLYTIIPLTILNLLYDFISNNRYKIIPKQSNCKIPSKRIIEKIVMQ